MSDTPQTPPTTVYEAVGGMQFFVDLVDRFYDGVATDPVLVPLYPEDLTEPRHHTSLFLAQYWGGPTTYNELRGHPRLRMRHFPFAIGQAERDAWLHHMLESLRVAQLPQSLEQAIADYFENAANHLVNQPG